MNKNDTIETLNIHDHICIVYSYQYKFSINKNEIISSFIKLSISIRFVDTPNGILDKFTNT